MSFDQSFLAPEAAEFVARLHARLPFPSVMERIEAEARRERQPAVGRGTGGILRALVASVGGGRVLEVGCNLGYSALWMASALRPPGLGAGAGAGALDTIEIDPHLARRARAHFAEAGLAERITVHEGAALDVLPKLRPGYDLVFLDAVKREYPAYLDHALRVLRPGGIVAADNLFWLGQAWDETVDDDETRGVREYTRRVFTDPRLVTTIVPSEDGLGVSVLAPRRMDEAP
jgi:predicted O-methyltransferase YrrM